MWYNEDNVDLQMIANVSKQDRRPVRKVISHSEYLEKRSRDFDVIWQLVRGDLTAHPLTVTLLWG